MFPAEKTKTPSAEAEMLIVFTKIHAVISGWVAGRGVLTGSMNALDVSSITGTILMIRTA